MDRPRLLRLLRIIVTVLSLTACVLVIVMWVRSYWWWDAIGNYTTKEGWRIDSRSGGTILHQLYFPGGLLEGGTAMESRPSLGTKEAFVGLEMYAGFSLIRRPFALFIPYWFLALLPIASAALPWMRWRFSLRTLLIATTLCAVVLGLVVTSG